MSNKAAGEVYMGLIFIFCLGPWPQKWHFYHIFADYTLLHKLRAFVHPKP